MAQRVIVYSKVKCLMHGAEAKASFNRALQLYAVDAKPSDLAMTRLKRG